MALSATDRERLQELGREIREILGGASHDDGTSKTFDELEKDSIEVTDVIGSAMLERNVREGEEQPSGTCLVRHATDCLRVKRTRSREFCRPIVEK